MYSEIGRSGFAGNAIAGPQGQFVCDDRMQACTVRGMRVLLIRSANPGIKAGCVSIEAVHAEPAPEYLDLAKEGLS